MVNVAAKIAYVCLEIPSSLLVLSFSHRQRGAWKLMITLILL